MQCRILRAEDVHVGPLVTVLSPVYINKQNKLMSSRVNPIFLRSFLGAVHRRLSTAQDAAVYVTAAVWSVQDLRNVQPTLHLWLHCPNLELPEPAPLWLIEAWEISASLQTVGRDFCPWVGGGRGLGTGFCSFPVLINDWNSRILSKSRVYQVYYIGVYIPYHLCFGCMVLIVKKQP